ncbi:MAG: amidohydrolase [Oscillospiraceae bacterium]|nr:amidohydrolase [Oscillospiraceae bacterium]
MDLHLKNAKFLLTEPDVAVAEGDIYICGDEIAAVGKAPENFAAEKIINCAGKLVIPGLVNCHTHAAMSIMRNYADDLMFHEWLFGKIFPAEDKLEADDIYWATLLSCMEMIRSGTTCFMDMYYFLRQFSRAVDEAGMRVVVTRGLMGKKRGDSDVSSRLDEFFAEREAMKGNSRFSFRLAPHAVYTCGRDFLEYLADLAKKENLGINTHVAESKKEVDDCLKEHGKTPAQYLAETGIFDVPATAAHCVFLTDGDIEIFRSKNVSVATNPVSNMKLGNGFSPVTKLLNAGVNVCAGTDGAASNNRQNLFLELAALSCIHKGVDRDAQSIPASMALKIGTVNGAKALGLNIGSIAPGKKADLAILDLNHPHLQPENNLVSGLIYSANGSEVETVIIDGAVVMENREFKAIDEQRVYAEMRRISKRILG